jgi:hypothetical protein
MKREMKKAKKMRDDYSPPKNYHSSKLPWGYSIFNLAIRRKIGTNINTLCVNKGVMMVMGSSRFEGKRWNLKGEVKRETRRGRP